MLVNIIFLDYERHDFTQQVKNHNFSNAGYDFSFTQVGMKGISRALNYGISRSKAFDAIVTMANDILMPDNWLLRRCITTHLWKGRQVRMFCRRI